MPDAVSQPTVGDVMTADVVTVGPDALYPDIVALVLDEGISAVPVVDRRGRLLGVVSETDLLRQQEHPDLRRTAREVMTAPALTVPAGAGLTTAADELRRTGLGRLFVVSEGGRLVGVLARRDLLRGRSAPTGMVQGPDQD